jgi:Fe-S cluster assembly protein SufD
MMATVTECSTLPELLSAPRPAEWGPVRKAAETALVGQELPTTLQEDWKYTDLKLLRETPFVPGQHRQVDIKERILPEARGTRLVFVNGHFDPHHSNVSALPPGVRMLRLASASEAACALGSLATPQTGDVFANLNTARFTDGAFIFVPKNIVVEPVLHILFVSDQEGTQATCSLPRLLVVLERGATLNLVEEYWGHGCTLTNGVTEVLVHEGAELVHERIQREAPEAFHVSSLWARLDRNARYISRTITLGARFSRQSPQVVLADEGTELTLDGLALLGESQVADTHSFIDHTKPHGTTHQLHKAIVDGRSRAIFNGRIFVRPGAQQTDAQQQSRNLLLSDEAQVDTKPELEIFADDVKCAHGAAVGQLDPEELFYLQSRGLNLTTARNLLTYGFAADLLARIPVPSLRRQLRQDVMARTNSQDLASLA